MKRKSEKEEKIIKRRILNPTNDNYTENTTEKTKYISQTKVLEKENIKIIKTGRDLELIEIENIKNITKINKNKIRVELQKYDEANRILENSFLQQARNIKAFIPKFCVETKIIIHDLPMDIELDDYKNNL